MIASTRVINLAGTLLVVIALVAGTVLTALPIYLESRDLNAQERTVAASNQLLQTQIDALRVKEGELPEVELDLAELHSQLTGIPKLDDATQLVIAAAAKVDAAIQSIEFGSFTPFAVRDAATLTDQLPQTATGLTLPAESNGSENGNGSGGAPAEGGSATSDPGATAPPPEGQLQFPVTISIEAPDQAAVSRFLDELRAGPRLLRVDTATIGAGEEDTVTLIATGFVFVSLG